MASPWSIYNPSPGDHAINIVPSHPDYRVEDEKGGCDRLSPELRDEMLSEVVQWAVQSGFEVTSITDSRHDFVIEVSERQNLPSLQVIHQRFDEIYVLMVGQVKVPQEDREMLKSHMGPGFDQFIWDLKLELVRSGVDFTVLGPEKDPDAWEVQRRLFVKGADVNQFHETYSRVKSALIGVIWSYKKRMDAIS